MATLDLNWNRNWNGIINRLYTFFNKKRKIRLILSWNLAFERRLFLIGTQWGALISHIQTRAPLSVCKLMGDCGNVALWLSHSKYSFNTCDSSNYTHTDIFFRIHSDKLDFRLFGVTWNAAFFSLKKYGKRQCVCDLFLSSKHKQIYDMAKWRIQLCSRAHTQSAIKFSITPDGCAIVYGYARGIYVNGISNKLIQALKCCAC